MNNQQILEDNLLMDTAAIDNACTLYENNKLDMYKFIHNQTDENKRRIIAYNNGYLLVIALTKSDVNLAAYLLQNGVMCRSEQYGEIIHELLFDLSVSRTIATKDNPHNQSLIQLAMIHNDVFITYFRKKMAECSSLGHEMGYSWHGGMLLTECEREAYALPCSLDACDAFLIKLRAKQHWKKYERDIIRIAIDCAIYKHLSYHNDFCDVPWYAPTPQQRARDNEYLARMEMLAQAFERIKDYVRRN
jgi:hypothetical protein